MTLAIYVGPQHDVRRAKDAVMLCRAELRNIIHNAEPNSERRVLASEAHARSTDLLASLERLQSAIEEAAHV